MQQGDVRMLNELIKQRIQAAEEDLETAESNLREGHYRAANNRAYHSICHVITAAFVLDNIRYESQEEILEIFNKEYVQNSIFSKELGRKVQKAREICHELEFDDLYATTKEEALQQIDTAERIIEAVKYYLHIG